jgi:SAM-dependent methyltransferase
MNYKSAHRLCPICSQRTVEVLHHQRFILPEGHPLPENFDIVSCSDCHFVYADTRGSASDYDDYYGRFSKYADQSTATGGGGNPKDQQRLEKMADDLSHQLPDLTAKIVDVGCANGGLLGAMKSRGYKSLLGVDPSPACVENTKNWFHVPAFQGWLNALPSECQGADLAIVSHVFEHVLDLKGAVECLGSCLSSDGILYIEVPDAARYVEFLTAPFQEFNVEHINHFCAASLVNLMKACGFDALRVETKLFGTSEGAPYPALFGFFHRSRAVVQSFDWLCDSEFSAAMNAYILSSRERIKAIDRKLVFHVNEPVYVWGTGQLTIKLLAETCLCRANIIAFVDGNPLNHGKTLYGRKIIAPEALNALPAHAIIVGSLLHHTAITHRIRNDLRLNNRVITLD